MLNNAKKRAMPPAKAPAFSYREQFGVIVVCKGERDQRAVYNRLRRIGYACKVVVT